LESGIRESDLDSHRIRTSILGVPCLFGQGGILDFGFWQELHALKKSTGKDDPPLGIFFFFFTLEMFERKWPTHLEIRPGLWILSLPYRTDRSCLTRTSATYHVREHLGPYVHLWAVREKKLSCEWIYYHCGRQRNYPLAI